MLRNAVITTSLVFSASTAFAVDYHVAPGGSDAAAGLTPATAWGTLQHAADNVDAGDTVHVANGNYAGFDLRTSGTAGNPVTFVADGPAVAITSNNDTTPDGINVENADYVVIDGFVVNNRTRSGIRAALGHHLTIRNCTCGGNGRWGIFTGFVDDLLIEGNETHDSVLEHGIYVSNSGDRPVIRDNHTHDNYANGIHMNGDESQGGDGTISDALVERNVIHGNGVGGGSGINMDGVTNSVVRNNLLYDNHASGISLYRIDGGSGSSGNLVINNTIINASDARWCVNIRDGSTGNTLRNNILYNHHSFRGVITIDAASRSGFSSDHNSGMNRMSIDGDSTVISFAAWQAEGYDASSFLAVPTDHFFNPAGDFHLLPTSPAIDAGTSTDAPGQDIEGGARPVGGGFDIGAYEAQLENCGDDNVDAGETCGEPALPACSDPCTTCLGCTCAPADSLCGDALVCGSEECEDDGDCTGGMTCNGCQCVNPSVCSSGIVLDKPRLRARAAAFSLRLKAEALIPKPWVSVNPAVSGLRFVLDSTSGPESLDAQLPGGAAWKTNGAGTSWSYSDRDGVVAGIIKAVVKDRSRVEDGRLRVTIKGRSDSGVTLPNAVGARTTLVLGAADECASVDWNGPNGESPACEGSPAQLNCR
ncbi:MAG: right-handed parallel beta-helix repeat-containing protein [Candidatus Binatia bacterium]